MWKEDVSVDITDWQNSMIKGRELRKYGSKKKKKKPQVVPVWPENRVYKWKIMENKIGKLLWEQTYRAVNARWLECRLFYRQWSPTVGECHMQCVLQGSVGLNWKRRSLEVRIPTHWTFYNKPVRNSLDSLENRAWNKD